MTRAQVIEVQVDLSSEVRESEARVINRLSSFEHYITDLVRIEIPRIICTDIAGQLQELLGGRE